MIELGDPGCSRCGPNARELQRQPDWRAKLPWTICDECFDEVFPEPEEEP